MWNTRRARQDRHQTHQPRRNNAKVPRDAVRSPVNDLQLNFSTTTTRLATAQISRPQRTWRVLYCGKFDRRCPPCDWSAHVVTGCSLRIEFGWKKKRGNDPPRPAGSDARLNKRIWSHALSEPVNTLRCTRCDCSGRSGLDLIGWICPLADQALIFSRAAPREWNCLEQKALQRASLQSWPTENVCVGR
jgi:hypothetical protein